MAMATPAMASLSLPSRCCSTSPASPSTSPLFSPLSNSASFRRRNGVQLRRRGGDILARAQQSGDQESKQLLDAFFLGRALAETVSERVGSLLGELLSEIGQRQAEQQRNIRGFQDEVQERARTTTLKAAQKALGNETPNYNSKPPRAHRARDEQNGSTSSAAEGSNELPSLPYIDLPPLDAPPSQQGTPDL